MGFFGESLEVGGYKNNPRIKIGKIGSSGTTGSWGIVGYDESLQDGGTEVFKIGEDGNTISGWEIKNDRLHRFTNTLRSISRLL